VNDLKLENRRTGETLRFRRVRGTDGGVIFLVDGSSPPHSAGPPVHVHLKEREDIVVKAGTVGAKVGKDATRLTSGGSVVIPAGVAHAWWNAGEDLLEMGGQVVPAADLDRYLQALFAVLNADPNRKPSIFYLAHVLWRHRHTQRMMVPPPPVQRILFPLVLLVGRILGKYRGTDWPGSPETCPGAPLIDGPAG
jgi:quercetin dioxygenase-like cupin family protein